MKKWGELKQATLDKLFLDEAEAQQQGYLTKFSYLANECLNIIANRVKPKIGTFQFNVYEKTVKGINFIFNDSKIVYTDLQGEQHEIEPNKEILYYETDQKKYEYDGEKLVETINISVDNPVIKMPDDFISFTNMINYHNGEPDPTLIYIGDKQIKLSKSGSYTIYYNAEWEKITKDIVTDNKELNIDSSVLHCLPSYIASQLLAQDDIQRSVMLKNEFELMLSGLDTDIFYQENHFKSTGGWY